MEQTPNFDASPLQLLVRIAIKYSAVCMHMITIPICIYMYIISGA